MNEQEFIARTVREQLERSSPIVLISLWNLKGSTPRHEGSKMVVTGEGKAFGTIGGSLLEAMAVEKAREALNSKQSEIFTFELSGEDTDNPGMICGGKTEILLDYLAPTGENLAFARAWHERISNGKDCFLLTCLHRNSKKVTVTSRAVVFGKSVTGDLPPGLELSRIIEECRNITVSEVRSINSSEILLEPVRRIKTVYCFGAGHVAVPTVHIAAMVGFHVIVIDDRPEFASAERFPEARQVLVIDDFSHVMKDLPIDEDSFIVIVTRGHQYDRVVLEQALKTRAGYIGMISSQKKRDAIYDALKKGGVPQEALDRVHSPIGIAIGGETPAEIAVSIVAELIGVRSGKYS